MNLKTVELFAGIGGFRIAADKCGLETVWANDIDDNAVAVKTAPESIPAADKIVGFTISMYAMVINVVIPATTSCLTFVSFSLSLKNLSIFYLPFLIFR